MDSVLLVARSLLAVVFVVAAIGKLADLAGSRQAMRDFGVPAPLAPALGTLLPLTELAVALASRGIDRLYSHQAEAYRAVRRGRNLVVVTPTASGKTLNLECGSLPAFAGGLPL